MMRPLRTSGRRPRLLATAAAAALALTAPFALTGCAPADDAADELRASVVRVAEHSADADFAGALAALLLLEREVDDAVATGDLRAGQEAEIRTAIDLVRADLQAQVERVERETNPAPTPAPDDTDEDDDSGPGNSGGNRNDDKGKKDKKDDD